VARVVAGQCVCEGGGSTAGEVYVQERAPEAEVVYGQCVCMSRQSDREAGQRGSKEAVLGVTSGQRVVVLPVPRQEARQAPAPPRAAGPSTGRGGGGGGGGGEGVGVGVGAG